MRLVTRATAVAVCVGTCALLPPTAVAQAPGGAGQAAHKEELSETYRGSQSKNVEYQKIAPFKVMDNLFYVGPGFVSVWLIPTNQGLILVDAAQEPYVDAMVDSIKKAGFDPKDIKYILLSHGHIDHVGGAARMQALSGARVASSEADWPLIEAMGVATATRQAIPVPKRDIVLKEGDTVTLGNMTMTAYVMGGHTPGALSFSFTTFDSGKAYKTFIFGGPGPRPGLEAAEQFLASAKRLSQFQDVQVAAQVHSWLNDFHYPNGGLLERRDVLARRKAGEPNPFIDNASWKQWSAQVQDGAQKNLDQEKAKAAAR